MHACDACMWCMDVMWCDVLWCDVLCCVVLCCVVLCCDMIPCDVIAWNGMWCVYVHAYIWVCLIKMYPNLMLLHFPIEIAHCVFHNLRQTHRSYYGLYIPLYPQCIPLKCKVNHHFPYFTHIIVKYKLNTTVYYGDWRFWKIALKISIRSLDTMK